METVVVCLQFVVLGNEGVVSARCDAMSEDKSDARGQWQKGGSVLFFFGCHLPFVLLKQVTNYRVKLAID